LHTAWPASCLSRLAGGERGLLPKLRFANSDPRRRILAGICGDARANCDLSPQPEMRRRLGEMRWHAPYLAWLEEGGEEGVSTEVVCDTVRTIHKKITQYQRQ
jgi:hypothetical protein